MSTTFSEQGKVVQLLSLRSVNAGATVSQADIDCRGFRWAYIVVDITVNNATTDSTLTITSSPLSGGSYSTIEDDSANMVAGGTNVSPVMTTAAGVVGTFFGEIDLDQHDPFLTATFVNGATSTTQLTAFVVLSGARRGALVDDTLAYKITSKDKGTYP